MKRLVFLRFAPMHGGYAMKTAISRDTATAKKGEMSRV